MFPLSPLLLNDEYTDLSLNNDVYNLAFDILTDRLDNNVDASINVLSTKVNNMFSTSNPNVPSSPNDPGELGEVRFDEYHTYIYCKDSYTPATLEK